MKNKKSNIKKLDTILKEQGFIIYPIRGISMLPLLEGKIDTVKIESVKENLKKYDVALYYNNSNSYTLHRIIDVSKNNKYYYIVGDNCNNLEKVPKNKVIGKMVGYFKKKRWVSIEDSEYKEYLNQYIINIDYKKRETIYPKIPNEWKVIFALIKASVDDIDVDYSNINMDIKDIDWEYILKLSKRHNISSLIGYKLDKERVPSEIYNEFIDLSNVNLKKTILFNSERAKISKILEENGIEYIYLKGIITNELYPKMGLREFADNDILVREKNTKSLELKKLNKAMISNGYSAESLHGVHDSYHKAPCYNFEFHRKLFDKGFKFSKYFNNLWDKAYKDEHNQYMYHMSNEDLYAYNLAHFYKHYKHGGAGIRSFVDMYLLDKYIVKGNDFDIKKKNEIITNNGLLDFEIEIFDLINKMFIDTKNLNYKDILYIMESGTYGLRSHDIKNALNDLKGNKVKYILGRIFIPYRTMKSMYHILKYLPFLLPIFWIVRLFRIVFRKETRNNVKLEMSVLKES